MKRSDRPPRRGTILAVVLAVLLVVMIIGVALTKAMVLDHRNQQVTENQQQAFWLAESALQRGIHRLAQSPDYQGETWEVPAAQLDGVHTGVATISIQTASAPDAGKRVSVEAVYSDDSVRRVVYHRELTVNSSSPGGSS